MESAQTVVLQETVQSSEHPDKRGGDVTSPQLLSTVIIWIDDMCLQDVKNVMQNNSEFHGKWNIKHIFISVFLSFLFSFLFFWQSVSLIEIEMSITKAIMFSLNSPAGELTYNSTKSIPIPQPRHLLPTPTKNKKATVGSDILNWKGWCFAIFVLPYKRWMGIDSCVEDWSFHFNIQIC